MKFGAGLHCSVGGRDVSVESDDWVDFATRYAAFAFDDDYKFEFTRADHPRRRVALNGRVAVTVRVTAPVRREPADAWAHSVLSVSQVVAEFLEDVALGVGKNGVIEAVEWDNWDAWVGASPVVLEWVIVGPRWLLG